MSIAAARIFLLLGVALPLTLVAQTSVPLGTAFTYQGELVSGGAPANGLFDLQVCLYPHATDPSAPLCLADFNDVPVAAGRFVLELDFGAVFLGLQRYLEFRVRPGASSAAYTALQPRQAVRPAPEALRAASTPWGGMLGTPPGFADNVDNLGVSSLSAGSGLSTGSGAPITTSGTLSIQDGGVTAAMIAPNAIGSAQIDATQVQMRVNGSCAEGEFLRGINADGSLDCQLLPVGFSRLLDSVGDVGTWVAVALRDDQRPVIAYHDESNGNLKFYDCVDATCSSGTRRILDSAGDVGQNVSIAIRPGDLPVIVYRDVTSQALKLYDCSNAACSAGTARTLDAAVDVAGGISLALRADGRPFIAYDDITAFQLRVYDCANLACSSGTARPHSSDRPYGTAIALRADGRPLIALGGSAGPGSRIRVFDCADAACLAGTVRNLTDLSYAGPPGIVLRSNARPMIVTTGVTGNVVVHDCADAACLSSSSTSHSYTTSDAIAVAMRANGRLLVAHGDFLTDVGYQLRLLDCGNASCSDASSRLVGGNGANGGRVAMALRDDDRPVLAYYDGDNDDLRLQVCATPDCS